MFRVKSFLIKTEENLKKKRREISILGSKMLYFKQLFGGVQKINQLLSCLRTMADFIFNF